MACFHPITAWRNKTGEIHLGKEVSDAISLRLPCGNCLGCRKNNAQAWALRCQLELEDHNAAVFTTLTYDDAHVPVTLPTPKTVLPLWIKRLRKNTGKKLRFFATAEYGERTHRPHFHAILYGLSELDAEAIQDAWSEPYTNRLLGHTRTEAVTPARIAYTAGYCNKKVGYKRFNHERVDPTTGEVYTWQAPYRLMSLRPGIGATAKKYINSWRLYATKDGHKMPVPRYLHEAWKAQATAQQLEDLAYEKSKLALTRDTSEYALHAAEQIAIAQHNIQSEKRHL